MEGKKELQNDPVQVYGNEVCEEDEAVDNRIDLVCFATIKYPSENGEDLCTLACLCVQPYLYMAHML